WPGRARALAESWRAHAQLRSGGREADGVRLYRVRPEARVVHRTEVTAVGELGIVVQVGEVEDGRGFDAGALEVLGEPPGVPGARPPRELLLDPVDRREAPGGGSEGRVECPGWASHRLHEALPVGVVVHHDTHPSLAAG